MRSSPPSLRLPARLAIPWLCSLCGALGGGSVLVICLAKNIADLGYAVLGGGFWTLAALVGLFGLVGAGFGVLIGLALLWQTQPARNDAHTLQPLRARSRSSQLQH
ncbi:hypothetical protein [Pedomonas sp. V897]|uniref:hypothetical protein n=1 Tax=Pedomonas sp. V897 TaxID=3446482 RepID=UPI003EE24EE5